MSLGTQQPLGGGEGHERDSPESLQKECSLGAIMILVYLGLLYTTTTHQLPLPEKYSHSGKAA